MCIIRFKTFLTLYVFVNTISGHLWKAKNVLLIMLYKMPLTERNNDLWFQAYCGTIFQSLFVCIIRFKTFSTLYVFVNTISGDLWETKDDLAWQPPTSAKPSNKDLTVTKVHNSPRSILRRCSWKGSRVFKMFVTITSEFYCFVSNFVCQVLPTNGNVKNGLYILWGGITMLSICLGFFLVNSLLEGSAPMLVDATAFSIC